MLVLQVFVASFGRSNIQRATAPEIAGDLQAFHQRDHAAGRFEAAPVNPRRAVEAIDIDDIRERTVDLPEQHRRARCRTAVTRPFAIDDYHLVAETRQMLCRERSGDPAADDQHVAAKVVLQRLTRQSLEALEPWRPTTSQVELFGRVL